MLVESAVVKRKKRQMLVLMCSTEYPLCVLVLVSESAFFACVLLSSECVSYPRVFIEFVSS